MKARLVLALGGLAVFTAISVVAACLNTTIIANLPDAGLFERDGGMPDVVDGGMVVTGPCDGIVCNGACIDAGDCRECSGAPLFCAPTGQCVSSCGGCADTQGEHLPIECFACDSSHGNPLGSCGYADAGAYCLNGYYFGWYDGDAGYRCACSSTSSCPGNSQVCAQQGAISVCVTCGETFPKDLTGQACKAAGKTCDPSNLSCK